MAAVGSSRNSSMQLQLYTAYFWYNHTCIMMYDWTVHNIEKYDFQGSGSLFYIFSYKTEN